MVSADAPLISNLSVLGNIALILEFHYGMSKRAAEKKVMGHLAALGMEDIAHRRNFHLTYEERFAALVLRALMVRRNAVAIDRPFLLMPGLPYGRHIFALLEKVEDLLYEGAVFDYEWNRERYEEG